MTVKRDIAFSIIADAKDFQKELMTLPNMTEKAANSAALRLSKEMHKGYQKVQKDSKKTADKQKRDFERTEKEAREAAGHMTDSFQRFGTQISSITGVGFLGDFEGLFDVARTSNERLGMSMTTAFTVGAGAIVLAGSALNAYLERQEELTREILATVEANEQFLAPETLKSMGEMKTLIDKIGTAYEVLAIEKLEKARAKQEEMELRTLAFVNEGFPKWASRIAAMMTRPFDEIFKQHAVVVEAVTSDMAGVEGSYEDIIGPIADVGKAIVDDIKAVGDSTEATDKNTGSRNRNRDAIKEQADALTEQEKAQSLVDDMVKQLETTEERAYRQFMEREEARLEMFDSEAVSIATMNEFHELSIKLWKKQVGFIEDTIDATDNLGDASEDAEDKVKGLASVWQDLGKIEHVTDQIDVLFSGMSDYFGAEMELLNRVGTHRKKKNEERRDQIRDLKKEQEGASEAERFQIQQEINALKSKNRVVEKQQRKRRKEMMKAWRGQKAANLASAIMLKSVAIARGFAELGPILGPVFATGTGLALAAEIKTIRNQRPPRFHSGGMVSDEVPAVLRKGEAVLSQRATNALGRDQVQALNSGSASSSQTLNFHLGGRLVESMVVDALRGEQSRRVLRPGAVSVGIVNPYVGR